MAVFTYDAINSQGLELSGIVHAPDLSSARDQLQQRGLLPQSLREKAAAGEERARTAFKKLKQTALKRRVKSAMVYPAVVITFASLVLVFMLLFIVPVFVKVFDQLGGQLPTPTRIVMGASNYLRDYWFLIFPAIGLAIYGFRR